MALRLTGQNVRGLTNLKLEKTIQFMRSRDISVTCLVETWKVTPSGVEIQDLDGCLIIHHGESTKTCKRGRCGVAIILRKEARASFEHGGFKFRHSSNGRLLVADLALDGGKVFKVGAAYSPCSGQSSEERQAFYDDVAVHTRGASSVAVFIDANASAGVGVNSKDRPQVERCAFGPFGERHINSAGQEFREFLESENLSSAASFFRSPGDHYATWSHPRDGKGYQLDHMLVKQTDIGRVKNARVRPSLAVESDHFPIYIEVLLGRMYRRQALKKVLQPNIGTLRNAETRKAFADCVASKVAEWVGENPTITLENRAQSLRFTLQESALEVCGVRTRREEGWFAASREVLMELVARRNQAEVDFRNTRSAIAHVVLKRARKALKRTTNEAKVSWIANQIATCAKGERSYWEAARAINKGGVRAIAVAVQKFLDEDGNVCNTPKENADAATKHFTKVYNGVRELPEGAAEAMNRVPQRVLRIELDEPISLEELEEALCKAKPGKATSNGVPVELLEACRQSPAALRCLHSLISDVFEDERHTPLPPPQPPPPSPHHSSPTTDSPKIISRRDLIAGAKIHAWRCQWQQENPKHRLSRDRYASYCAATTYAEAISLGAKVEDFNHDHKMGYLQIFPDSLRVEERTDTVGVDTDPEENVDSAPATALMLEFARMRLKILPKKGDLRDLNNWRGIMLLDAASKIVSMIINSRLQRLLKEVGIEAQNGFTGGRGCADGSFCIRQALKKRREHGLESWVLFVDLVKAFDSVPRDVLFAVLKKFGAPPHLIKVIKRMNTDLQVTFDLGGEPVAVPCTVGVKQGCPLSPTLFLFVMQACLDSLESSMPADVKLEFRTNTRTQGQNGGNVSGTDWTNKGEFSFGFWASLYADDAATPTASRAKLLMVANALNDHTKLFGLLMHVGDGVKKSKTEGMYCPARNEEYGNGDTSDLVLNCGGRISFTESFVYLGSLLHRDLSDHHDVEARLKKAAKAFGALRDRVFSSKDIPERLKGKLYAGGVLAVLLYGCESWCLTAASIKRLSLWHNKRIREMCRVTMCQTFVHQITSRSLQQRTGVYELQYYIASRALMWAGHVARMPKSRLPKRLMLSWVHAPRTPGGQEMNYGRSLERHLKYFDVPTSFVAWAELAQDRGAWRKLVTKPPFQLGKPFKRKPRGDTRATAEEKQRAEAELAEEVSRRRETFDPAAVCT